MNATELTAWIELLGPHIASVSLCAARLLPIVILCPLFGGFAAPVTVRLGLVLTLSLSLHFVGGVGTAAAVVDPWAFAGLAMRELLFGVSLGLIASLPFDAARIGGRFIDLVRGTSAEAVQPVSGTRESATGECLHQMLIALAVSGPAFGLVLSAVWRSFGLVQLGTWTATEGQAMHVVQLAGSAMATGLAIGAPIAGCCLAIDLLLGLVSRAGPQSGVQDLSAPLRILAGGAVLWIGIGVIAQRLMSELLEVDGAMAALLAVHHG